MKVVGRFPAVILGSAVATALAITPFIAVREIRLTANLDES